MLQPGMQRFRHGCFSMTRRLRGAWLAALALMLSPAGLVGAGARASQAPSGLARARVPFVENRGQLPDPVAFHAATFFGAVFVRRDGRLVYLGNAPRARGRAEAHFLPSSGWSLSEEFVGGQARPTAGPVAAARVSEFRGSDPARWRFGLASCEEVRLGEVWPGVLVALRARGRNVEKVFTVRPGANAGRIRLRVEGAGHLAVADDGSLVAGATGGRVRFAAPVAYQERDGKRLPVFVAYAARGATYSFRLARHDPALPLTIDPELQSTYVGGDRTPTASRRSPSSPGSGEVLVAGYTYSSDFPGTARNDHLERPRGVEAFVARFDAGLTTLLQATYFGGSGGEEALGIAVHPVTRRGLRGRRHVVGRLSEQPPSAPSRRAAGARTASSRASTRRSRGSCARRTSAAVISTRSSGSPSTRGAARSSSPDRRCLRSSRRPRAAPSRRKTGPRTVSSSASTRRSTAFFRPPISADPGTTSLRALTIHPGNGEILIGGQTLPVDGLPGHRRGRQRLAARGQRKLRRFPGAARPDPDAGPPVDVSRLLGGRGRARDRRASFDRRYLRRRLDRHRRLPGCGGGCPARRSRWEHDCFVARLNSSLTALAQSTYFGGEGDDFCNAIAVHPSRGDVYVAGETYSRDLPGARRSPVLLRRLRGRLRRAVRSDADPAHSHDLLGRERRGCRHGPRGRAFDRRHSDRGRNSFRRHARNGSRGEAGLRRRLTLRGGRFRVAPSGRPRRGGRVPLRPRLSLPERGPLPGPSRLACALAGHERCRARRGADEGHRATSGSSTAPTSSSSSRSSTRAPWTATSGSSTARSRTSNTRSP